MYLESFIYTMKLHVERKKGSY